MRSRNIISANKRKNGQNCVVKQREMISENGEKIYRPQEKAASGLMQSILQNSNLALQILVIMITLASDQGKMERGLDNMTGMIDKLRKIADVLDTTMGSVRTAAETPQKIRQLLK